MEAVISRRSRFWKYFGGVVLLLAFSSTIAIVRPQGMSVEFRDSPDVEIVLEPWITGLKAPMAFALVPDGSGRILVIERAGVVRLIGANGAVRDAPVLDIGDRVDTRDEGGMLSIAIQPGFDSNTTAKGANRVFLSWTTENAVLTVAEFLLSEQMEVANPEPRVVLEVPQSSLLHNGGALVIGPDGYLYISVGDGSKAGVQGLEAQRLDSLLGKILRVDINTTGQRGQHYGIPDDNPFVSDPDARPEIYAFGLRNPWRMTFHGSKLWVGDVGGEIAEEINVVEPGGNYGWPLYEGNRFKFLAAGRHVVEGRLFEYVSKAMRMNLTGEGRRLPPIAAYDHAGGAAITGGVLVGESAGLPDISGRYLFADFIRGTISSLKYDQDPLLITPVVEQAGPIVFFGEGRGGEILVVSLAGEIFRLSSGR